MPLALWSSMSMPWDLRMEYYPKLWQNSVYITWKQGFPSEDVGLAMTLVATCRMEYDTNQMVLDLADKSIIKYPALRVDDEGADGNNDASMAGDCVSEDDSSDSEDIDDDLQQVALEVANKTNDSGFQSGTNEHSKIEVLPGNGTRWTGLPQRYSLGAPARNSSFLSGSRVATQSEKTTGASFDQYIQHAAGRSGRVGELMGGQALLQDHTSPSELAELCKLAEEQIEIACHFDAKFSKTAFALLQKTQTVFVGMGGITKKFVDDMAMASLNFIRDATAYEAELCSSDTVTFAEGLSNIRLQIADLIKEAAALELMYEGAQKDFAGILQRVGAEVKEYLDKQATLDCMAFMDESFANLRNFSDAFNVSTFIPVIMGMAITHHLLLMSLRVNISLIPMQIYLMPLTSGSIRTDGAPTLCGSAEHSCVGETVLVEAHTWTRPRKGQSDPGVQPRVELEQGITPHTTRENGINTIKEGPAGG